MTIIAHTENHEKIADQNTQANKILPAKNQNLSNPRLLDIIEKELAYFSEKVYPTERKLQTIFNKMLNLASG